VSDAVELADLERRLERLESEREIMALLHRYSHVADYGDRVEMAELYLPDGRFEVR
jgi:hypothetical protein